MHVGAVHCQIVEGCWCALQWDLLIHQYHLVGVLDSSSSHADGSYSAAAGQQQLTCGRQL
jgi:hypothetical protein